MSQEANNDKDHIENIISEVGFGKFQIINYIFILLAVICTTIAALLFVFTARDASYRCSIPRCDSSPAVYDQVWLSRAIPVDNGVLNKCEYFAPTMSMVPEEIKIDEPGNSTCDTMSFDHLKTVKCDKWVYGEGDSIVKEFGMPCDEWRISLVGTINGVGQMMSLLLSGILSDKYGRRNVMAILAAVMGVVGLAQSFLTDYWSFLIFEFLHMLVVRGANTTAYIFAIEILSSKQRVFGSVAIELASTSAVIALGLMAWALPSWRILVRATAVPVLIVPFAVLFIPESFRWLNAKGRIAERDSTLRKAATWNNKILSQQSILKLQELLLEENFESRNKNSKDNVNVFSILKNRQLTVRTIACSICWFANVMLYYGIYLNSIAISNTNNVYLNFIYVALCEYLALVIYTFTVRFMPRKLSLFVYLFGTGMFCVIYAFVPKTSNIFPLATFLITKVLSSCSFKMLYIYTTEIFPTSLRNSSMSLCSVVARIGGSLASQVQLLAAYHPALPMCCYGMVAGLSAFTAFGMPETRGKNLPDTIAEAEEL